MNELEEHKSLTDCAYPGSLSEDTTEKGFGDHLGPESLLFIIQLYAGPRLHCVQRRRKGRWQWARLCGLAGPP